MEGKYKQNNKELTPVDLKSVAQLTGYLCMVAILTGYKIKEWNTPMYNESVKPATASIQIEKSSIAVNSVKEIREEIQLLTNKEIRVRESDLKKYPEVSLTVLRIIAQLGKSYKPFGETLDSVKGLEIRFVEGLDHKAAAVSNNGHTLEININDFSLLNRVGIKSILVHEFEHIKQAQKYNFPTNLVKNISSSSYAPNKIEEEAVEAQNEYNKANSIPVLTYFGETPTAYLSEKGKIRLGRK